MIDTDQELAVQNVTLLNDFGSQISFTGRLMAENSTFDEASGVLTNEKVYENEKGVLAYGVVAAAAETRERRAYLIGGERDGARVISNGRLSITADTAELLTLLAMACAAQDEGHPEVECSHIVKTLKAANL